MFKEVREGVMTMSHQVENFNKEIDMMKKQQMEILEWKVI